MKNSDKIIIIKIHNYIEQIQEFIEGLSLEKFSCDNKTISACVFNLSQIGELVTKFSDEFLENTQQIPWRKIRGLRNKIVHDYDGIQLTIVWEVITEFLPELILELQKL